MALDAFVAVTAIGGGGALIAGLERDRCSTAMLRRTPFRSFTVPALLLACVVGGSALVAAVAALLDARAGAAASAVAGVALGTFIAYEVARLEDGPGWSSIEAVYFAVAAAMVLLALAVAAGG